MIKFMNKIKKKETKKSFYKILYKKVSTKKRMSFYRKFLCFLKERKRENVFQVYKVKEEEKKNKRKRESN